MEQILIRVVGAVVAALALNLLHLNTKRVVISHAQPIGWIWKAMALAGKILFFYGLFVYLSNLFVTGPTAPNTGTGAIMFSLGLILWIWGGLVIYFKRN